jgi:uncharacterized protein (TIGR03437 family)
MADSWWGTIRWIRQRRFWRTSLAGIYAAFSLSAQVPSYTITTVAGGGSNVATGAFQTSPVGLALDAAGDIYFASFSAGTVFKVSASGVLTTVAGGGTLAGSLADGGPAVGAALINPEGLAIDSAGNLYISEGNANRIRKVSPTGIITLFAGSYTPASGLGDGGPATSAFLNSPIGLSLDSTGQLYIAEAGGNRIRKVALDGTISTIAGPGSDGMLGDGGLASAASLRAPTGVAVDSTGDVYIADAGHNLIRKVSAATQIITTVAGDGVPGYSGDGGPATLANIGVLVPPNGVFVMSLAVDDKGDIFIADEDNFRVREATADGNIYTVAGNGSDGGSVDNVQATLTGIGPPTGIAIGTSGRIFITQSGPGAIRLLTPSTIPFIPTPVLEDGGVISASSYGAFTQTSTGSWIEIHGSYLAPDTRSWTAADFTGQAAPESLDGASVTIGGQPAFVSYISPGQINAQVPSNITTGLQPLIVTTSAGKTPAYPIQVNETEPGLLAPPSFLIGSNQYVGALFSDGATWALPVSAVNGLASRPAKAGDILTLYGIGFGELTPAVSAGQIDQQADALVLPLHILLGSIEAQVTYAGLAPSSVGLYQFDMVVPSTTAHGPVPITFTLGGVAGTQTLLLSIQ